MIEFLRIKQSCILPVIYICTSALASDEYLFFFIRMYLLLSFTMLPEGWLHLFTMTFTMSLSQDDATKSHIHFSAAKTEAGRLQSISGLWLH